jgi:hypothetical protein
MRSRQFFLALATVVALNQVPTSLPEGLVFGADEIPPPPYLVSRANHVLVGIVLDESVVKGMLPTGVQPAPGGTGGINIYQVEEASGLPLYSSFYVWVDVEGYDAPDGTKGRWMLAGAYAPAPVPAALAKYYGYPTREGAARIEWLGEKVRAVGTMAGKEIVSIELIRKKEPCQRAAGIVNEVTRNAGTNRNQVIKFPFAGEWCSAEPGRVEVNGPSGDPFGRLQPVKILWAGELRAAAYAWVPPVAGR